MKFLIIITIAVGIAYGGWQGYNYWLGVKEKNEQGSKPQAVEVPAAQLPGMPAGLEPALEASRQLGAKGLRDFLTTYGRTISDPRLASIELDYVVLVSQTDIAEARKVFAKVKQRTPANSPVYGLVKKLQQTYE